MFNKGILSLVSIGLLASNLFVDFVKAEVPNNDLLRKEVDQQLEMPLPQELKKNKMLNQLKKEVNLKGTKDIARISSSNNDYVFETENNDDFVSADQLTYEVPTIGQLLPMYDIDFHKITVPNDGVLLVAGQANSYAIDLAFVALQKDFIDNNNLKYIGGEFEEGIEYQAYQAKKGTYYVGVFDLDYDYGIDDNTANDLYAIAAGYLDNVPPPKPTVNKVDNNDKVVTGKAEANSTVTVKSGSKVLGSAKATNKGTFSVKIAVQKAGSKLTVTAKDSAGNVSPSVSVTVKDVVPPTKPTVNKVDNNDKVVAGKAEANSTVTVKNGSKVLGSAKATSKGTFSVKIAVQKAGSKLTITAKDSAGNVSPSVSVSVKDVVPPKKPTVNKVDDNDKKVTGKAEANSTVTVKVGSKKLGSAKVNSKGNFTVKIAAQKKGTKLSITAKDVAGNVSPKVTITVVKH